MSDKVIANKKLMAEWDFSKNTSLDPALLSMGSEKKAWWICPKKHHYESSIVNRAKSLGCPYCNNKKALAGFNDLATQYPDIIKEWDYQKNSITPNEVLPGSGKRVWWKCKNNHSYETYIYKKVKGSGCPYCANQKLLKGFNDLATTNPELIDEWDYQKNSMNPDEVIAGTDKKVWWKCSVCGNEWQAVVHSRTVGHGCPICGYKAMSVANSKPQKLENSLIKKFPDVIKVWNYDRNGTLKPENFGYQSNKKVWWKCPECGHEWESQICTKSHEPLCGNCSYKKNRKYVIEGTNDIPSTCPELLKEWDYEKNTLTPNQVSAKSKTVVWWKCKNGHEWQASLLSRTKHGINKCPYCSNQKLLSGFNDIATLYPELIKEWDYEKNKVDPHDVIDGSHLQFYWKCNNGHSYVASAGNRIRGTSCPYCSGHKSLKGFNDFATLYPELLKEWDYNKNTISPYEITAKSGKKVWWKCKYGHEWQSVIINRTSNGKRGCPYCSNRKVQPGFNDLATINPELLKEWDYEKNKISPKEVIAGSTLKAWWKCEKGHSWKATIVSRNKNHFCPICNASKSTSISEKAIAYYLYKANVEIIENYKIGKRELDIYIPNIKVGIEYDGQYYHKSIEKDLVKNKLCEKSQIKLIRIREPELPTLNSTSIDFKIKEMANDHSYMNDVIKQLLSYLDIQNIDVDVTRDFNEIYALFQKGNKKDSIFVERPDLIEEWDYKKNTQLNPEQLSKGVHIKAWWICKKCGYSWQAMVYSRVQGSGCPQCNKHKDIQKPSSLLVGENDLLTLHPELIDEWDYEKNKLAPNHITCGSNRKVWWICSLNHSYISTVCDRVHGKGCPYCSNKKILLGYNDLATTNPELLSEWNYDKNELTPFSVTKGSQKKVWWTCKHGHEYQSTVYYRVHGNGCPYCSNHKILTGYNDLATTNPELLKYWDFNKNKISPTSIGKGSKYNAWWICEHCNSTYQRFVGNQTRRPIKCPICKK